MNTVRWLVLAATVAACKPSSGEQQQQLAAFAQKKVAIEADVVQLQQQVIDLDHTRTDVQRDLDALRQDQSVLVAEKAGRGVHYILHCSIRQVHFSLSIRKQIADAVNEESFDLPTDKASYEHAQPGSDLFESFRAGSAIFKGSLGSWRIKVESKRIETDPT